MDKPITANTELQKATDALAEALVHSEPFVHYRQTSVEFKEDPQAMQLMQGYSSLQQKIRSQQPSNQPTKGDLARLRELQERIAENEIIQEYSKAQESAIRFLREVNQEISQMLGVDFASLTPGSGCC